MKRSELQSNLAMTILLTSGAMLFATLFMGYAIYRTSNTVWLPLGYKHSLILPAMSTLIILISSWFCSRIKIEVKKNNFIKAQGQLNITLALGLGFLLFQSYLWYSLKAHGLFASSGIFASILYGFTWIHAAHVVCGVGSLIYLKWVLKPVTRNIHQKAVNVEKFWHFLGVIWLIMFVIIFVI